MINGQNNMWKRLWSIINRGNKLVLHILINWNITYNAKIFQGVRVYENKTRNSMNTMTFMHTLKLSILHITKYVF